MPVNKLFYALRPTVSRLETNSFTPGNKVFHTEKVHIKSV